MDLLVAPTVEVQPTTSSPPSRVTRRSGRCRASSSRSPGHRRSRRPERRKRPEPPPCSWGLRTRSPAHTWRSCSRPARCCPDPLERRAPDVLAVRPRHPSTRVAPGVDRDVVLLVAADARWLDVSPASAAPPKPAAAAARNPRRDRWRVIVDSNSSLSVASTPCPHYSLLPS